MSSREVVKHFIVRELVYLVHRVEALDEADARGFVRGLGSTEFDDIERPDDGFGVHVEEVI